LSTCDKIDQNSEGRLTLSKIFLWSPNCLIWK